MDTGNNTDLQLRMRIQQRKKWFAENQQSCFAATLLVCGPPPPKGPSYNHWLCRCWDHLWFQIPPEYKVNDEYYHGYGDRSSQVICFQTGFITWLNAKSGGGGKDG